MESFSTFGKFALTKLMSVLIFGLSGFPASASHDDRSWHEDYMIGKSDIDAAWYYERRRWRS